MKLEKRKIWLVLGEPPKGYAKELNVLSAFSTRKEAEDKVKWYEETFTKGTEPYIIQEIETWFPTEY